MALRDEAAVQEQRRKKAGKKLASVEVPTTSSNGKKTKKKSRDSLPKGSFLESVSSMMDQPNTTAASTTTTKKKKKPSAKDPVRQMDEANQQPRKKSPAARRPLPPPPPPPPVESPPTRRKTPKQQPTEVKSKPTEVKSKPAEALAVKSKPKKTKKQKDKAPESTMSFLESVQAAMKAKEQQEDGEQEDMVDDSHMENHLEKKKQKKKKVPKLSLARQQSLQEELAKRRMENKIKRRQAKQQQQDDYVEDETVEPVGWFQLTVKENNNSNDNNTSDEEDEQEALADKKKAKKPKQIKTTVEYSRHYDKFLTKKDVDEAPPGYYLEMLTVKKRHFHIQNLFAPRPLFGGRVYKFDGDRLQEILDKKDDKWFVKSRMASYLEQIDLEDEQDEDDDEKGMEALSIFFGPNEIDKNNNSDDCDDIFSIASVESVHFSDDDEAEHEKWFQGRPRDTVEVMPGEFTILRKPEETHHAIETGTYIESLCLGCGKALLSVQDAVQVACPSCGSITPLNAICLHKPFGIATGVAAAKVTLAPRKSVFDGEAKQKAPTRKVVTGVSTRWIKEPPPLPMPGGIPATIITDAAAAPRKPAQRKQQQAQRRPKETAQRPRGGNKQPRTKPATKPGAVPVPAR